MPRRLLLPQLRSARVRAVQAEAHGTRPLVPETGFSVPSSLGWSGGVALVAGARANAPMRRSRARRERRRTAQCRSTPGSPCCRRGGRRSARPGRSGCPSVPRVASHLRQRHLCQRRTLRRQRLNRAPRRRSRTSWSSSPSLRSSPGPTSSTPTATPPPRSAWCTRFPRGMVDVDRRGQVRPRLMGTSCVSITTVTNLVRHGCRDHSWADPPVGPSVDDLAAALADLAPFRVTSPPKDVTIYGYSGKHLELTVPDLPVEGSGDDRRFTGCEDGNLKSWVAAIDTRTGGRVLRLQRRPGCTEEFWILDVEGTRLMIEANGPLPRPPRTSPRCAPSSTPSGSSHDAPRFLTLSTRVETGPRRRLARGQSRQGMSRTLAERQRGVTDAVRPAPRARAARTAPARPRSALRAPRRRGRWPV